VEHGVQAGAAAIAVVERRETMAVTGVNVALDGSVNPTAVAQSNATWVRIVATPGHDLTQYMSFCSAAGVKVLLLIASESVPSLGQMPLGDAAQEAATLYHGRYNGLFDALQVCNEPDGKPPSSWVQTPDQVNEVLAPFRNTFSGTLIVGPGLCSGDPTQFDGVDLSLLDVVSVHPYGQGVPAAGGLPAFPSPFGFGGDVEQLLNRYKARFGKPVWISEWGSNDNDLGEAGSAEYVERMIKYLRPRNIADVVIYFCWSDSMVPKFGLLRADGTHKPAYDAFR